MGKHIILWPLALNVWAAGDNVFFCQGRLGNTKSTIAKHTLIEQTENYQTRTDVFEGTGGKKTLSPAVQTFSASGQSIFVFIAQSKKTLAPAPPAGNFKGVCRKKQCRLWKKHSHMAKQNLAASPGKTLGRSRLARHQAFRDGGPAPSPKCWESRKRSN